MAAIPGIMDPVTEAIVERRMWAQCLCFGVRKAARSVTQVYDGAFRALGLKATQATLLFSIQAMGPIALSRLADHAVMDRTSLTRNLKPLVRQGLVDVVPGLDGRVRLARLTPRGTDLVRRALPLWDEVQTKMRGAIGEPRMQAIMGELEGVVQSVKA